MLARIAIVSGFLVSLCSADNFIIKDGKNADSFFNTKNEPVAASHGGGGERSPAEPMRVVIEDVNPNSDLGQAIRYILKEGQAKEMAEMQPKPKKKPVKKKPRKKPKKKSDDCAKPVAQEHVMEMSQMPSGETINAKEAPVVEDKPKEAHGAEKKEAHGAEKKEAHGAEKKEAGAAEEKKEAHGAAEKKH